MTVNGQSTEGLLNFNENSLPLAETLDAFSCFQKARSKLVWRKHRGSYVPNSATTTQRKKYQQRCRKTLIQKIILAENYWISSCFSSNFLTNNLIDCRRRQRWLVLLWGYSICMCGFSSTRFDSAHQSSATGIPFLLQPGYLLEGVFLTDGPVVYTNG